MPDKIKFTKEEFERRERDILRKHRMPADVNTDLSELLNQTRISPSNNGNGQDNPNMANGGMTGYGQ